MAFEDTISKQHMTNVAGIAYLGRPCSKYKVGLVEDKGDFSGIPLLAHELGHS